MGRARTILAAALAPDAPVLAELDGSLAGAHFEHGDLASARHVVERGIELAESQLSGEHETLAYLYRTYAVILETTDSRASINAHMRALSISEKALGPEHPEVAHARLSLAVAL